VLLAFFSELLVLSDFDEEELPLLVLRPDCEPDLSELLDACPDDPEVLFCVFTELPPERRSEPDDFVDFSVDCVCLSVVVLRVISRFEPVFDCLPVVVVVVPDCLELPDEVEPLVEVDPLVVPLLPFEFSVFLTLPVDPPDSLVLVFPVVRVPLEDVPDSRDPDPVEVLLPLYEPELPFAVDFRFTYTGASDPFDVRLPPEELTPFLLLLSRVL
jgi:hypothetical protein